MRMIDEDDVKRAIRKVKRDWMLCTTKETETALKVVEGALAGCKTIDAAPVVHAKWRYKAANIRHVHVTNIIWCTACDNGFHRIIGVNFKFCPNCGAKMDGDPHDSGQ